MLDQRGVECAFHDDKTAGIERAKLAGWARQVGWETLLNKAGKTFHKLPDKNKEGLTEAKAISLILAQLLDHQAAGARTRRRQAARRLQAGAIRDRRLD